MRRVDPVAQLITMALDQCQFRRAQRAFAVGDVAKFGTGRKRARHGPADRGKFYRVVVREFDQQQPAGHAIAQFPGEDALRLRLAGRQERREVAVDLQRYGEPDCSGRHQYQPTNHRPAACAVHRSLFPGCTTSTVESPIRSSTSMRSTCDCAPSMTMRAMTPERTGSLGSSASVQRAAWPRRSNEK